jgi:uncharacterized membrane protein
MNALSHYGPLAGRILIAAIFVFAGLGKVTGFEGTVGYIASKGLPLPQLAAIGAILVELGGGIMLVLGWKTRWAAAALFLFTGLAALPQFLGRYSRPGTKPDDPFHEKHGHHGRAAFCNGTWQRAVESG